ncbi:FAA2 Long-chain-fatty-acid--CoA ligase 2 [Candida maltosa Xu316]|uniref:Putative long chain fatty acyl-CoA synthetase n=1 Tax=Candida maltosa (strain Xu316) TaxID=1245528 RepID=M3JS43_CANMX|nr:putative long chain fatty acyl-CoA synthetase [Candida maltosa Xu316]
MSLLPSISNTDPIYASDDKNYVFENAIDLPLETLINHVLPFPQEISGESVKVPGTATKGYSEIYRNAATPNGLKTSLVKGLDTFHAIFESAAKRYADDPCLAYHEYDYENSQHLERYVTIPYKTVHQRKNNFAAGLFFLLKSNIFKDPTLESHQKIDNHSKKYSNYDSDELSFIVTFYSGNRVEWIISDLACSSNSVTSTALYDTLGPEASKYILETTESPVIICSKDHVRSLVELKNANRTTLSSLIMIISMDPLTKKDEELIEFAEAANIKLYDFTQVEGTGAIFPHQECPPTANTVFTITFTSGTTGANPKGVLLPQVSCACGTLAYKCLMPFHKGTREFSFLPLAHIYERNIYTAMLSFGGVIAFPRLGGTLLTLIQDLKLWKPNFLANVPRIFTKMEAGLKAALDVSPQKPKSGTQFDKQLSWKLKNSIGFDDIDFCFTGSAPISEETIKFMKSSLGIGFGQGYGSSESFGGILISLPFKESSVGTCGVVVPTIEARIRELPEMGYLLTDANGPRGELEIRGPQVFTKYFKNEAETKKSMDKDGWFSTGDVAEVSAVGGYFKIVDRVKNFYKMAQGEYISPERIEGLYLSKFPYVTQLFVHGDSTESYLVGVAGLDPSTIGQYIKHRFNQTVDDPLEFFKYAKNRRVLILDMNKSIGKKLQGFEKLHNIFVDFDPLKLERQVVTPTMKIRRPIATKFFRKEINDMYHEGSIIKDYNL